MANKFYISDCHFPICEWNAYYRNSYHLFGHIYGRLGDNCLIMRSRRNAYNAAVDNIVIKRRYIILNIRLVENLQKTACGGSVISTDCERSQDLS